MKVIITKITAVCLTGLVAMSALGAGMVLCLGEDGHVGLESLGKKECCSHDGDVHGQCADEHGEGSCAASNKDNCHGCVDMPIPQLQAADVGSDARFSKALHYAIAICTDRSSQKAVILLDCAPSPPLAGSLFTAFPDMTVVLRI